MKILTKKQQEELLKKIAACQITAINFIDDGEAFTKMTENLSDLAYEIGGPNGCDKVTNTVHKYVH